MNPLKKPNGKTVIVRGSVSFSYLSVDPAKMQIPFGKSTQRNPLY